MIFIKKRWVVFVITALLLTSCNTNFEETSSVAESSDVARNPASSALVEFEEADVDKNLIKKTEALFDIEHKMIQTDAEKLIEEYPNVVIQTGRIGGPSFYFGDKKAYWLCPPFNKEVINQSRFAKFIENYNNKKADMIYICTPSVVAVVNYSGNDVWYTVATYRVKNGEVSSSQIVRAVLNQTDRSYYIVDTEDLLLVLPKEKEYNTIAVSEKPLSETEIVDKLNVLVGEKSNFSFEGEKEISGEVCKCFVTGENTENYAQYAVSPDLKRVYCGGFPDGNWWLIVE